MAFNSMSFLWIFLPITLILYYITFGKLKNLFLVLASLIMYAWGSTETLPILLISILANYMIGLCMSDKTNDAFRKFILVLGIIFNLGILSYYKYYNFIAENINILLKEDILQQHMQLGLPIGISFFTFSAISYLFDLYRRDVKPQKNIINLGLYLSFFPKLTMGPIESYRDFEVFIRNKEITATNLSTGIRRFIYGLAKKVVIANSMGIIADKVFNSDVSYLTTQVAWIGAISYMIQIYFDFSGYSDMAIGLGKMFGINMEENFDLPYMSKSITEFWRRWHISLSTWFKNYLYIPLGGNRKGKVRTYINLFIVFFTTGLWHGASWNFIVWGLFNGFFMIIERIKLKELLDKNKFKILNHIYTIFVILISWVLFRANTLEDGLAFIKCMFINQEVALVNAIDISTILTTKNLMILVSGIFLSGIIPAILNKFHKVKEVYEIFIEPFILIILFIACIMYIINGTYISYIYANF